MVGSLQRVMLYAWFGVCSEVFFTAMYTFIKALTLRKINLRMIGHSNLWVMPLYGLGGRYVLEPLHTVVNDWNIFCRYAAYGFCIITLEYLYGAFLKMLHIRPWRYYGKWQIHGLINLKYLPAWGVLGLLFELMHNYLSLI